MKIKITDLSYSEIVNQIQGEENKGSDMLVEFAEEREIVSNEIKKLETEINRLISIRGQLYSGSKMILKHLKKEIPIIIARPGFVVIINNDDIKIERNVI